MHSACTPMIRHWFIMHTFATINYFLLQLDKFTKPFRKLPVFLCTFLCSLNESKFSIFFMCRYKILTLVRHFFGVFNRLFNRHAHSIHHLSHNALLTYSKNSTNSYAVIGSSVAFCFFIKPFFVKFTKSLNAVLFDFLFNQCTHSSSLLSHSLASAHLHHSINVCKDSISVSPLI